MVQTTLKDAEKWWDDCGEKEMPEDTVPVSGRKWQNRVSLF
ncbi:MAG: hypothetical protein R2941_01730 [Desulfobacterales bacterium]